MIQRGKREHCPYANPSTTFSIGIRSGPTNLSLNRFFFSGRHCPKVKQETCGNILVYNHRLAYHRCSMRQAENNFSARICYSVINGKPRFRFCARRISLHDERASKSTRVAAIVLFRNEPRRHITEGLCWCGDGFIILQLRCSLHQARVLRGNESVDAVDRTALARWHARPPHLCPHRSRRIT